MKQKITKSQKTQLINTVNDYVSKCLDVSANRALVEIIANVLENEYKKELSKCFTSNNVEQALMNTLATLRLEVVQDELELKSKYDSPLLHIFITINGRTFAFVDLIRDKYRLSEFLMTDVELKTLKKYGFDIETILNNEENFYLNTIESYFCDVLEEKTIQVKEYANVLGVEVGTVRELLKTDRNTLHWEYIEKRCDLMKEKGYINCVLELCKSVDKAYKFLYQMEAVNEISVVDNFIKGMNRETHLHFIKTVFSELSLVSIVAERVAVFEYIK